jgi:hypothetical protein
MRSIRIGRIGLVSTLFASPAASQWAGFEDRGAALASDAFTFDTATPNPERRDGNENYYDGDFADWSGDGLADRALLAQYGALLNTGGGVMTPANGPLTGYQFGAVFPGLNIGNDGVQWADVDGDGDYDSLQGGNGEPFTLQRNRRGRFSVAWQKSGSALNIVNTDLERDGDVDLLVAHAFCSGSDCGGPVDFSLFVNDGTGDFTEEATARGIPFTTSTDYVVGVVSGDVDADADYDFLVIHGGANEVKLARNDGTGIFAIESVPFARPIADITWIQSGFEQGMNLGDVDGDGDLDLFLALGGHVGLHPVIGHVLMINDGTGTFADESAARFDEGAWTGAEITGGNGKLVDLDYDGDLDIVSLKKVNDMGHPDDPPPPDPGKWLHVFVNDGAGNFAHDDTHSMQIGGATTTALGADTDVTDLDGDGTYDLWVGLAAESVHPLINTHVDTSGLPADLPRDLEVASFDAGAVTLRWKAPPFGANARYYKVYRAASRGLGRDRAFLRAVGQPFQDEGFAAPLSAFATAAQIGDDDVFVDADGLVHFTDRTVRGGVTYRYAVSHVGTENTESRPTCEVEVTVAGSADVRSPDLEIASPTADEWSAFPRIVLHYADGEGVDVSTLRVSFDAALGDPLAGGRAAGADLSDLFHRKDAGVYVLALEPPLSLPVNTFVTLTASVDDLGGSTTLRNRSFYVGQASTSPPVAGLAAMPASGAAPLEVDLSADASSDADGKVFAWEWYFSDGTTAVGRHVEKVFPFGGDWQVKLLVRDDQGGVGTATQTVSVTGPAPDGDPIPPDRCEAPDEKPDPDGGGGPGPAPEAGSPDGGTELDGAGRSGCECGVGASGDSGGLPWIVLALASAHALRREGRTTMYARIAQRGAGRCG